MTGFLPERETGEERRPIAAAVHEGMILPLRLRKIRASGTTAQNIVALW